MKFIGNHGSIWETFRLSIENKGNFQIIALVNYLLSFLGFDMEKIKQ